jgi:hypothetical protein
MQIVFDGQALDLHNVLVMIPEAAPNQRSAVNPLHRRRDGQRAVGAATGLVDDQICSLRGPWRTRESPKLFEMDGFPVSPPVNQMPACEGGQNATPRKFLSDC